MYRADIQSIFYFMNQKIYQKNKRWKKQLKSPFTFHNYSRYSNVQARPTGLHWALGWGHFESRFRHMTLTEPWTIKLLTPEFERNRPIGPKIEWKKCPKSIICSFCMEIFFQLIFYLRSRRQMIGGPAKHNWASIDFCWVELIGTKIIISVRDPIECYVQCSCSWTQKCL